MCRSKPFCTFAPRSSASGLCEDEQGSREEEHLRDAGPRDGPRRRRHVRPERQADDRLPAAGEVEEVSGRR